MPPESQRVLCYVTDRKLLPHAGSDALLTSIRRAVGAGVDWVQIREKDLPGGALCTLTREAVAAARARSARIIVNDRLDVAVACGAGGVHLGGESLPVADVVSWCAKNVAGVGAAFLIGRSCHSLEEAQQAERDGAHYIHFGPVFATPAKLKFGPPQGAERLAEVCRAVRIPVLAIGGVTLENAAHCFRAGATGIAAIRLFQEAADEVALTKVVSALRSV